MKVGEKTGYYEHPDYLIAHCFGHMTRLKNPDEYRPEWKRWEAKLLRPQPFEKVFIDDKRDQTELLIELINRDEVASLINAGDAGREGEGIQRDVYEIAFERAGKRKPIYRFWTSDVLSKKVICSELENLKKGELFDPLYASYLARERSDWLVGFNATRSYTALYARGGKPLSIGRVQTPVLALIVRREEEIEQFSSRPFWNVVAKGEGIEAKMIAPESEEGDRFAVWDESDAKKAVAGCRGKSFEVIKLEKKEKKEYPPKLFSMPLLQQHCNKAFGWAPERTLELAQNLYEKRFTTYPRTDSAYLGNAQKDDGLIAGRAGAVAPLLNLESAAAAMLPVAETGIRIFNEKKLTDHHAIIPSDLSDTACRFEALDGDAQSLFEVIARRFIMAFLPPAVIDESEAELACGSYRYIAKASAHRELGWKAYEKSAVKNAVLALEEGERLTLDVESKALTTSPPSRFTQGDIINAMTNAHRYVKEGVSKEMVEVLRRAEGIGTGATRDKFVPLLEARGYIAIENNVITPLARGRELIRLLGEQEITDFAYTALHEFELKQIEEGASKGGMDAFLEKSLEDTKALIRHAEASRADAAGEVLSQRDVAPPEGAKIVGTCPECGKEVVAGAQNYYCIGRKNGCRFVIWYDGLAMLGHKKITESEIKKLLKKKPTTMKLKKQDGRVFEGEGNLEKNGEKWRVKIDFDAGLKAETLGSCPRCGAEVIESPQAYGCSRWREGCDFKIWKDALKRFGGKKITKTVAKRLLSKGEDVVTLKRKNGQESDFFVILDENFGIRVDFNTKVKQK